MPTPATLDRWTVSLDRGPSPDPLPAVKQVSVAVVSPLPVAPPRAVAAATPPAPVGFIEMHPRFRAWLSKCGINSSADVLSLTGEVICGHPDRHVLRVELYSGVRTRVVYLKREHVVGRKVRARNRRAGFGPVSRCTREATILRQLEDAGLAGPQWLAYGEDSSGQAFLLVDELAGSVELRDYLGESGASDEDRRAVFERAGNTLAEWHLAGFSTPELAAKHLFVSPESRNVTMLDWQSAQAKTTIADSDRVRWLGTLHATLADHLATPRERLRFLVAYRRTLRRSAPGSRLTSLSRWVNLIVREAELAARKSSVLAQRQSVLPDQTQRLVWLAGEAVVTIPEVAVGWPHPPVQAPFYRDDPHAPVESRERIALADGTAGVLVRFRTAAPLGRTIAALRERPWRSPAAIASRVLFHLQRHGIPAPRLLAFGQRLLSRTESDSFVLAELSSTTQPVLPLLKDGDLSPRERFELLCQCGAILRQLHAAGCRPNWNAGSNDPLFVVDVSRGMSVGIGSPWAVQLERNPSPRRCRSDVRRVLALFGPLSQTDRRRFQRAYDNIESSAATARK